MPSGPRIRDNNVFGLTLDAPLTSGATTFNSLGLAKMSVVSSAHSMVTLDPIRQFGEPEIVVVTVHTAAATVATITRAAYGTVARSHPVGTLWVSQPIDEDFIEILTAATRPGNPYEGQFIFETDTNKLVGYGGVDWAPRDAGGQLGYAQVVADQTGIGTTETSLTGLAVTVIVPSNRRIRISSWIATWYTASAALELSLKIKEDTTQLSKAIVTASAAGVLIQPLAQCVLVPAAGSHTYRLAGQTNTGTINMGAGASYPAYILVEDIGAA